MSSHEKSTIKKYVIEDSSIYIVRKKVQYSQIALEEKLELFQRGKEKKLILNESYNDVTWKIQRDFSESVFIIPFEKVVDSKTRDALKTYILLKHVEAEQSIGNLRDIHRYVIQVYEDSHHLETKYIGEFTEKVSLYKQRIKNKLREVIRFLQFYDSSKYKEYIKVLELSVCGKRNWIPRDLPDYHSSCLFSEIVFDYYSHCDIENKIYYLPLFLWWFLSSKIPLRPTEVFILEKKWLYEKGKVPYLHIERCKSIVPHAVHNFITEFELDERTYHFLQEIISLQEQEDDSKYICSITAYQKMSGSISPFKEGKERFVLGNVRTRLGRFLTEVVEKKYGYTIVEKGQRKNNDEIERICLGDTRHLAFMNLMQLGYNPLLIAQLGGHTDIETQMGYYNHFDTFSTSKTLALKEVIEHNMSQANLISHSDTQILSIMQTSKLQQELNPLKILQYPTVLEGHGKCSSKSFPFECIDEGCLYCKNFIAIKDISEYYLTQLQKMNEEKIGDLKKTISVLLRETCLESINAKILEETHKALIGLFNQNAIIKTYQLIRKERKEIENTWQEQKEEVPSIAQKN